MTDDRTARRFFLVLLAATTLLLALVMRPLATALFMAAVLAGVLEPLHAKLASRMRGRIRLAAAILVLAVVVVLVGPVVALAIFLLKEGNDALKFVADAVRGESVTRLVGKLPESLEKIVTEGLARLLDVNQMLEKHIGAEGGKAAAAVWGAVSTTGSVVFGAAMMLIALYFLLVQGDELVSWLDDTLPLRRGQMRELLAEFKKVSFSVIASTVITAGVQALAAFIGFLISRVPHPIFFMAVSFFLALVPALGAPSVCLFAAGILYITGHPYLSLFLAVWGVVVVGLVDNVIKPLLIKHGMEMRSVVVFFSLIGGLGAFGAVGLVIGPLVVALFLALVRIYRRDFRSSPDGTAEPLSSKPGPTS
jgi:predicted PurR-regulated permease PerM